MATLMTWSNSRGTRRCDAKCYGATTASCECICGGRYHGIGAQAAQERLHEDFLGPEWKDICETVRKASGDDHGVLSFRNAVPVQGGDQVKAVAMRKIDPRQVTLWD